MANTKPLLLVHKGMQKQTLHTKVNILLTPQFYSLKRESVPVRYAYQAKRIAPSLFEGLLDKYQNYSYFVKKESETWLFIAYDMQEIEAFLKSKGISSDKVGKIFFAEQARDAFVGAVKTGEKEALVKLDDSVVIVPQVALENNIRYIEINDTFTPSKGITLEGTSHSLLSRSQTYALGGLFAFLGLLFFVEASRYNGENAAQQAQIEHLLASYPALQSSYSRESIASKYKTINRKERHKREVVKALSRMIFKGTTLTSLVLTDRHFQAQFSYTSKSAKKKLQSLAQKEKFSTVRVPNSHSLKIEGTL